MPILNRAAEMFEEVAGWRRQIHRNPELGFDLEGTAAMVAGTLSGFGLDRLETGIARTGLVGLIHGKLGPGPVIGLRADMDALPIEEASGKEWSSLVSGKMHACGHDGHTAMLLGAAKYLAETRNFAGSVAVIFQPAEEGGGGGKVMIEEGLMERFGIERIFGMHNMPGLPVGHFALRPGPLMAATAEFNLTIHGKGTHAAMPHQGIDPIIVGTGIVAALQTIVSRSVDANDALVVSVTRFNAGTAHNVIPAAASLGGTCRYFDERVGRMAEQRMATIIDSICAAHGATASFDFDGNYPPTVNDEAEAFFAGDIAASVAGETQVDRDMRPLLGGEDFSYMLQERPGAMIFVGNGDTAMLHHPAYDFNDDVIPYGISYWVALAEAALKPR